MKREKELVCIVCPVGCVMHVKQDGDNIEVEGNQCKRGVTYAVAEMTDPKRMVTSSISVDGGDMPLVSIKTAEAIPKDKIDEALKAIQNTVVKAPVKIGDALIKNVAGTDVNIVATRNVYV